MKSDQYTKNKFLDEYGIIDPLIELQKTRGFKPMVRQEVKDDMDYWNPEKIGDKLEGQLIGSREGDYGKTYKLKKDDKVIGTPSHRALQGKMESVPNGAYVWIELVDIKDTGKGNPARIYKVEFEINS